MQLVQPLHELATADLATHPASCLLKDQVLRANIAVQEACLVDGSQGLASGSARESIDINCKLEALSLTAAAAVAPP